MSRESLEAKIGVTPIVPHDPNPNMVLTDIVQEVIRKAVEITAAEPTAVEVKESGVLDRLLQTDLEFSEEIVPELA